jgi:5'(3')-deoxyribonucleotidase
MRILVDLDGVTADFYGSLLDLYNEEFGDSLTREDLVSWELSPEIFTKTTTKYLRGYFDRRNFWSGMKPIPGAVESLKYLHSQGHDILVVTAVPLDSRECCYEKLIWVEKHLPFIGHNNFVATLRKSAVSGDILFDDGPHNIEAFPALTCAMDAAYNRSAKADFRVKSWESFIKVVEGIAR